MMRADEIFFGMIGAMLVGAVIISAVLFVVGETVEHFTP
jgi:hypothetical protein